MDVTWTGFLRGRLLVGDKRALLIKRYATRRPSNTKRAIRAKRQDGTLDDDAFHCLMGCVDELATVFKTARPCVVECDGRDWLDLGNGGQVRRSHVGGGG